MRNYNISLVACAVLALGLQACAVSQEKAGNMSQVERQNACAKAISKKDRNCNHLSGLAASGCIGSRNKARKDYVTLKCATAWQ